MGRQRRALKEQCDEDTDRFCKFLRRVSLVLCLFIVVLQPASAFDDPPIRVARLSYVAGQVSFSMVGGKPVEAQTEISSNFDQIEFLYQFQRERLYHSVRL
jgi:hypothetical protein